MYSFITPTPKPERDGQVDPQKVADSMSSLRFFIVYVLFPLAYLDFYGYLPNSPLFGPIFIFIVVPVLDTIIGLDGWNPSPAVYSILERRFDFRLPALLWFPAHCAFLYWGIAHALPQTETYNKQWWGLVFNFGICSGIAINMAHELIHKTQSWIEHYSGCALLSLVCYGHFAVEHIDGHHRRVSTLDDPASSRKNENVYFFLPRSIIGGFLSAFHLDAKKSSLLWLLTFAMAAVVYRINNAAVPFFCLTGSIGAIYLELINYVEHYGLSRDPKESVSPMHSWNFASSFQNDFLLRLQRHSDHHANGGRRFQSLRTFAYSPTLPVGYATMIIAALIPPLFFRIMNPRVEHAQELHAALKRAKKQDEVFTDKYLEENDYHQDMVKAGWVH